MIARRCRTCSARAASRAATMPTAARPVKNGTLRNPASIPIRLRTSSATRTMPMVTNDGTYSYQYDAVGNLTQQTTLATGAYTKYAYDNDNRLTSVSNFTNSGVQTQQVSYVYDVFGNLLSRSLTLYTNGVAGTPQKSEFIYDDPADNGQIVLQFQTTGSATPTSANLTDHYLWGPAVDQLIADEQVSGVSAPGTILWPLIDNQGTVRAVANSAGQLLDDITYTAFGQILGHTASNPAAVDTIFGYTGKYTDPATSLQWNEARWYNPVSGTFLSPDPAQADVNTYRYAGNGPTNGTDPRGLAEDFDGPSIGGRDVGFLQGIWEDVSSWWNTDPTQIHTFQVGDRTYSYSGAETQSRLANRLGYVVYAPRHAEQTREQMVEGLGQRWYIASKGYGYSNKDIGDINSLALGPAVFGYLFGYNGIAEWQEQLDMTGRRLSLSEARFRGLMGGLSFGASAAPVASTGLSALRVFRVPTAATELPLLFEGNQVTLNSSIFDFRSPFVEAELSEAGVGAEVDPLSLQSTDVNFLSSKVANGNLFNRLRANAYPYNEIYIEGATGTRYVLDSYNPELGEIVCARRHNWHLFAKRVRLNYIREAAAKYAPGSKIAEVPTSGALAGARLQGNLFLEIPMQAEPVPEGVLDAATKLRITIRDVYGKVYNP